MPRQTQSTAQTSQLRSAIRSLAGGSIFGVRFIKRTDGEIRDMVCRLGASNKVKGDAGNGPAYDPIEKGLLPVWDMQKDGFRSIPLDNIIHVKIKGTEYPGPAFIDGR